MKSASKNGRKLTGKQQLACSLLAEDRYSDDKICEVVGTSRDSLWKWKKLPAFSARVDEIAEKYAEHAVKHGIARRERRLRILNDFNDRLLAVIEERAKSMARVPGGKTGLLVKQRGTYEVDTATIRTVLAIHEQAATELGQKIDRQKLEVTDLTKAFEGRSEEDLEYFTKHGHWPGEECTCKITLQ